MRKPSRHLIYTTRTFYGKKYHLEAVVQEGELYRQMEKLKGNEIEVIDVHDVGRSYYAIYVVSE